MTPWPLLSSLLAKIPVFRAAAVALSSPPSTIICSSLAGVSRNNLFPFSMAAETAGPQIRLPTKEETAITSTTEKDDGNEGEEFPSSGTSPRNQDDQHHRYLCLYKPALTLCTFVPDPEDRIRKKGRRDTLADIGDGVLADIDSLHTVGRLDMETEGLLLLTTNGKFTANVHARCRKKYWVLVEGSPEPSAIETMRAGGLKIRGAVTRPPVALRILPDQDRAFRVLPLAAPGMDRMGRDGTATWLEIVLDEGRNRQVRRITKHAGHRVIRLCRVAVGGIEFPANMELKPGEWKPFEKDSVFSEEGD